MSKSNRRSGDRFYTKRDVAEQLDASTRTVSRWIERGDLKAHKLGRLVRIAGDDLDPFLASRRGYKDDGLLSGVVTFCQ
jgi:excisionase family DNA binding protein